MDNAEIEAQELKLRRLAFADILSFQPDQKTGKDLFEQIATHARSTIIEAQTQIAKLYGKDAP